MNNNECEYHDFLVKTNSFHAATCVPPRQSERFTLTMNSGYSQTILNVPWFLS